MNPNFKWLLIGAGALVLLLVLLTVFASCQAVSNAERRTQELAAQLDEAQNATPAPTATPSPTPIPLPTSEVGPVEPQLPTASPTQEPMPSVEPLPPTVQPTATPKPIMTTSTTKRPTATPTPAATGESTAVVAVMQNKGFSFGLPTIAYTDTVVQVKVLGSPKSIRWTLYKDGQSVSVKDHISGTLQTSGGYVTFREPGLYTLDGLGDGGAHCRAMIRVYPLLKIPFTVPASTYRNATIEVKTSEEAVLENQTITWTCTHQDGAAVDVTSFHNEGGTISFPTLGTYTLTARVTDPRTNRVFEETHKVSVLNQRPNAPTGSAVVTSERSGNGVKVELTASSTDPDGDPVTLEWSGRAEHDIYSAGAHIVRVRARDSMGDVSPWTDVPFEVPNTPPEPPTGQATIHRENVKNRMAKVTFDAQATDPDGDALTYEWADRTSDDYYELGTHTARVRARDSFGDASDWTEVSFEIANQAPGRPEIARLPADGFVLPGTPVTITANAADPDGDAVTYIWDNRPEESFVYPDGRQVVRVKAVDAFGAESARNGLMFIVGDPNRGGGMVFGTGTHETTQLCMAQLDEHVRPGMKVIDLGCGSGILSVAALLLGADCALGVDIDPNAVDIAYNNADENGIARDRYTVVAGNVLDDNGFVDSLGTGYDIVVANIVAGVIVPLTDIVPRLLKKGGLYITSGIIAERAQEVIDAMQRNGFTVTYTENRKDWMVIVATR